MTREKVVELHNQLAGEIVAKIVKSTIEAGGDVSDVVVLTESVIVGVALAATKLGVSKAVPEILDVMIDQAKERLAEIQLRETSGLQ